MIDMKICVSCGREMQARKAWDKNWNEVKFCSAACRRNKNRPNYETQIIELLKARGAGKTICPSELLGANEKQNKSMMEDVRASARKLAYSGQICITQKGQRVDPSTAKGPIRLKLL